ncbi:HdaA/DnaA family protein [Roseicyclus persicicus]|uniref:Chromosomal replication initiator DnaA n=1 Tax=Roseicyclus persicicus TaxID=2650661 RepID=A0A7X6JW91_9RHOB|nr:DnaA/Hda family protein [Roseibacterium persicicum]NKX43470.1 chromosomal replication initiator DnaA [Roseibacterium persicicum]
MAEQLVLDLPFRAAMGRADFFVSEANAAAVAALDGWRSWPGAKLVLTGPAGSGKTHLAHVFAAQAGARILPAADLPGHDPASMAEAPALAVEDADRIAGDACAEEALFHLHNAAAGRGTPLLLTARAAPARWGLALPDLASRMQQAGLVALSPPDDALVAAVLVKLAADRQLALSPAVVAYILPRIDRSLGMVQAVVAALDAEALAHQQKPGLRHVKAVLARLQA